MYLKIRNRELETLIYILYMMKLGTRKSRMRTKMLKILDIHLKELQESVQALVDEYALFDEMGQLIFTDEEKGIFQLKPETSNKFHYEQQVLLDEEIVIEVNEVNKMMMLTVAHSFLEEDVEISQDDATIYDNLCEQFEAIIEHFNKTSD